MLSILCVFVSAPSMNLSIFFASWAVTIDRRGAVLLGTSRLLFGSFRPVHLHAAFAGEELLHQRLFFLPEAAQFLFENFDFFVSSGEDGSDFLLLFFCVRYVDGLFFYIFFPSPSWAVPLAFLLRLLFTVS